jgi:hypothetical protein
MFAIAYLTHYRDTPHVAAKKERTEFSGHLRGAPFRMLPRVGAPAQALEVEVLRVAEEVPLSFPKISSVQIRAMK